MNSLVRAVLSVIFIFSSTLTIAFADNSDSASTPAKIRQPNTNTIDASSNTIIVHKPATDPSWGKVIQYNEEQVISPTDHTKETVYKFLFQDSENVVRLAVYHESTSGTGYWEVWIWDQP